MNTEHRTRNTLLYLLPLIFLLAILIQGFTLPGHDLAWLSLVTAWMLDGKVLYHDVLEPAPPLILWIYALPVAAARLFAWQPVLAIKYFTIVAAAFSVVASAYILKRSPLWSKEERGSLILGIAGVLLLLPDSFITFGQREHLVVIFVLPYLLASLPSIPPDAFPRLTKILLGAAAALGLCIKPYFFAIWVAALAWRLWHTRSRRIIGAAEITIVLLTLAYLAAIAVFTPQYFDWLRLFAPLYGDYGYPADTTTSVALWFVLLAIIAILLAWAFGLLRLAAGAPYRQDVFFLMSVAMGAYFNALLQFKTWQYVVYPFEALLLMAILPVMLRRRTDFLAIAVMAMAFYPITPLTDLRQKTSRENYARISAMLAPYRQSREIYFISDYMTPQLYRDTPPLAWASKFNSLNYFLFGIMQRSPVTGFPTKTVRPGQEWRERWLRDAIADDVAQKRPSLLVIAGKWDTALADKDQYLNLGSWLAGDKKFARLLAHYTLAEEKDACPPPADPTKHCLYQIYRKTP